MMFLQLFGIPAVLGTALVSNLCLSGDPFEFIYGVSLITCVRACACHSSCDVASYDRFSSTCGLYHNSHISGRLFCPGSLLYASEGAPVVKCGQRDAWSDGCVKTCRMPDTVRYASMKKKSPAWIAAMIQYNTIDVMLAENDVILVSCRDGTNITGIKCIGGNWTPMSVCMISTIGQPCNVDADCLDIGSECRKNLCWCNPGLSHDAASTTCVSECPGQYGDTFQLLDDHLIPRYIMFLSLVDDLDMCLSMCLKFNSPGRRCVHASFGLGSRSCGLHSQGAPKTDGVPILTERLGHIFITRDCAI